MTDSELAFLGCRSADRIDIGPDVGYTGGVRGHRILVSAWLCGYVHDGVGDVFLRG